jgi:3-oxoacyl-[acyl-carrier protein] reductase
LHLTVGKDTIKAKVQFGRSSSMDFGIKGQGAVVAAASKGLGRACAVALAAEGVNVAIFARDQNALNETAAAARAHGVQAIAIQADVTQPEQIRQVVDRAADEFGRLDILVCNAGGPPPGTFATINEEQWEQAFHLNLMSMVRLVNAALPHMRRQGGGRIITLVSTSVREPIEGLILSNSIRSGVIGLAKSLSQELGPDHITVNNIITGSIMTDRQRSLRERTAQQLGITVEEAIKRVEKNIPLGRLGEPEELAALVAFLASRQAAYITGTSIPVDGGILRGIW